MIRFSPIIVHYHLYPGGVSSLILSSLKTLIESDFIQDEIIFVLGTMDRSKWFFDRLQKIALNKVKIKTEIIPGLMYWDKSMGDVSVSAEKIKRSLLKLCNGGQLIWAHNPTLGKNPAYMLALKLIAVSAPDLKMFLHVHDSAEQGRWPNLNLMRSSLIEPYYFISPGTQWLVINMNDYDSFIRSGMPKEHISYFPDVVLAPDTTLKVGKDSITDSLRRFSESNGYYFDGKRPWVLYAGRTIRRKNLLEALAVNLCAPERTALLITLPSDSLDDKPYEEMVFGELKRCGAGVAGFGPELVGTEVSLGELGKESSLVISSSVMEGFGLPYLEFPILGRPVFAKANYIMQDFKGFEAKLPLHFYESFMVPVEASIRDYQLKRYLEKVRKISDRFNIPEKHSEKLNDFFVKTFHSPIVDFSYLSASEQYYFIHDILEDVKHEVFKLNDHLYAGFEEALADKNHDPSETSLTIGSRFGQEIYLKHITGVFDSINNRASASFNAKEFQENLLTCYFNPEDLRLLLDYRPYN